VNSWGNVPRRILVSLHPYSGTRAAGKRAVKTCQGGAGAGSKRRTRKTRKGRAGTARKGGTREARTRGAGKLAKEEEERLAREEQERVAHEEQEKPAREEHEKLTTEEEERLVEKQNLAKQWKERLGRKKPSEQKQEQRESKAVGNGVRRGIGATKRNKRPLSSHLRLLEKPSLKNLHKKVDHPRLRRRTNVKPWRTKKRSEIPPTVRSLARILQQLITATQYLPQVRYQNM
jgi:hypothetical protein